MSSNKRFVIVQIVLVALMAFFAGLPLVVSAMMQPQTVTLPAGADVQAAINAATGPTTIILQAGATYPAFVMKSGIKVVSSRSSEITGRVAKDSPLLAKVRGVTPAEPVVRVPMGTTDWAIDGLDLATATESVVIYDIVRVGEGKQTQTQVSQAPSNGAITHCYIHGWPTQDVQRGVSPNGANLTISESYISDIHMVGIEAQAIGMWNGPGPLRVINNYLEGAGENIMIGGSDSASPEMMPANVEIRRNYLFKPLSWKVGDPSYAGKHWTVKNIFELKAVRGAVVDGNVFENNWTDAQDGSGILFTVRNQECTAPWSTVQNVTFTNNTVRGATGAALNMLGLDNEAEPGYGKCTNPATQGSIRGTDLLVKNNRFYDIGGAFLQLNGFYNVTIERNTSPQHRYNTMTLFVMPSTGLKVTNNLLVDHEYGIFGDGGTSGVAALNKFAPGWVMTGNVIAKPYDAGSYPPGNQYPVDLVLPADLRSPIAGVGCDVDALLAAQSGVGSAPTPTPTPVVTPTPVPSPSPSPSPIVTPTPTPTPAPSPTPTPPSSCSMSVTAPTLTQWSSGKLVVNLSGFRSPTTVTVSQTSGQVAVDWPNSQTVSGSSAIIEFGIQSKKKSSAVIITDPCGGPSKTVMVNVQ